MREFLEEAVVEFGVQSRRVGVTEEQHHYSFWEQPTVTQLVKNHPQKSLLQCSSTIITQPQSAYSHVLPRVKQVVFRRKHGACRLREEGRGWSCGGRGL